MGQSFTCLHYHLIFSTKDRLPMIVPNLRQRLYDYIGGIIKNEKGALLAASGMPDHIHLLTRLHAQSSIADILRDVKANSSRWIHETFNEQAGFAWQSGYGAFAVSYSNLDQVREYIANQETHHRKLTFQEEFVQFLKRHGIEFDERYLWV